MHNAIVSVPKSMHSYLHESGSVHNSMNDDQARNQVEVLEGASAPNFFLKKKVNEKRACNHLTKNAYIAAIIFLNGLIALCKLCIMVLIENRITLFIVFCSKRKCIMLKILIL